MAWTARIIPIPAPKPGEQHVAFTLDSKQAAHPVGVVSSNEGTFVVVEFDADLEAHEGCAYFQDFLAFPLGMPIPNHQEMRKFLGIVVLRSPIQGATSKAMAVYAVGRRAIRPVPGQAAA